MNTTSSAGNRAALGAAVFLGATFLTGHIAAAQDLPGAYRAINPTMADKTITLTGHDLTIEQVIQVARYGAKVQLTSEAKQRQADNFGLLMQGQLEGVPIYLLNRGGGLGRENVTMEGDAMSPENKPKIEQRELAAFQRGPGQGGGPEISEEELVRATMVVRANIMTFETPSAGLSQMLIDLLNKNITPVVQSRGTVGEADLANLANIGGAMVGRGEVYYRGTRMPAAQALQQAGLESLKPFGVDSSTLNNSNSFTTAQAALLVSDARDALDWASLTYAMDLNGMNSSVTPLSRATQVKRPHKWLNWEAARVLDMMKGSYLFNEDPKRVLADPDSLRASAIRQGSAWQAWAALRDAVLFQMNSSDHNPAVTVGLAGKDSWELATPMLTKYFVKGGKYSNGKSGYIVSNANWDPYPMVNEIEAFTIALANLDVVITQRIYRFNNQFFTVIRPADVLPADQARGAAPQGGGSLTTALWQEIQVLTNPVPAEGISTDTEANGDIESQSGVKVARAREAVDLSMRLIAQDLLTGSYWMNVRKAQDANRSFGKAPDAALAAFRAVVPWQAEAGSRPAKPVATIAYEFVKSNPVTKFYPAAASQPGGDVQIPIADPQHLAKK